MFTLSQALQEASDSLRPQAGDSASHEAQILLCYVLGCNKVELICNPDRSLSQEELKGLRALTQRRQRGEPIAKILGKKEFWSLSFQTNSDTLDPRPDTETLIESVLSFCKDREKPYKVLDLGAGTGCILLSLLFELPNAKGKGIDISDQALKVAEENGAYLGLSNRIHWQQNDWCEGIDEGFDIIVSNPPYISETEFESLDPTVQRFDPKLALVSGPSGLECYKKIIEQVDKCLAKGGIFAMEIGIHQEQSVSELLTNHGFKILEIRKDLANIPRCIVANK